MKPITTLIVASAAQAAVASAQPAGAQAEILFRQGKELLAKGQIADACAAFDASEKLDPTTSTVLNQANCREKSDQLATAWGLYLEAERATRTASDALGQQMHDTAVTRAAKLEPRLSTLTIAVPEDAKVGGLEIVRDQDVVDHGAWNKTLPIDGGTYRIIARAPGNAEWSTTITVGNERDTKTVEIPRLKSAEIPKPAEPPAPVSSSSPVDDGGSDVTAEPVTSPHRRMRWLPYAVGGGGVMLLGGALALDLAGNATYDKSKASLDSSRQLSLWQRANTERYAAEALAVAGVASVGIATWLYIRSRRAEPSIALAPIIGGHRAGIQLVGGF